MNSKMTQGRRGDPEPFQSAGHHSLLIAAQAFACCRAFAAAADVPCLPKIRRAALGPSAPVTFLNKILAFP
jgi:hypothetical protein